MMPEILTYTGKTFNYLNPTPDMICIEDIAHSISNACRYAGHCNRFYSVAQHSIIVSSLCKDEYKLWGLLHDATEAYLVDVPTPLKPLLPGYKEIENNIMSVIAKRFGLEGYQVPKEVKKIDKQILFVERDCLFNKENILNGPVWSEESVTEKIEYEIVEIYSPYTARQTFLDEFYKLT